MSKIKIGDCFQSSVMGAGVLVSVDEPNAIIQFGSHRAVTLNGQFGGFPSLPTLHLPIGNDAKKYGGRWFDMILSGVKKEEYREVSAFYESRFYCALENPARVHDVDPTIRRDLKVLHLTNGYGHDKPQLWAHIESITIGRGKPEWGAPTDRDVFIIKLGEVFHTKNLK